MVTYKGNLEGCLATSVYDEVATLAKYIILEREQCPFS